MQAQVAPDADTVLDWELTVDALRAQLPDRPTPAQLSLPVADGILRECIEEIRAATQLEDRLLTPLSLDALCNPEALLQHVHVHPQLPAGMYARSQPYRRRIEISPPSSRFWDPRYHLEGLCDGQLVLELRALQHELVHLRQVRPRRELTWLVVLCLVPVLWPVLVYLLFARLVPLTAVHVLTGQEIQAHLHELELGASPSTAPAKTVLALAPYPFVCHLRLGELEALTAAVQALRAMGAGVEEVARLIQTLPPRRGIHRLSALLRRRGARRGWNPEALKRVVRRHALLQELEQLHVQWTARTKLHRAVSMDPA